LEEPAWSPRSNQCGELVSWRELMRAPRLDYRAIEILLIQVFTGVAGHALFARDQADHAEVDGEDSVVGRHAPGRSGLNVDAVLGRFGQIGFNDK
jgi:hypothetical protein